LANEGWLKAFNEFKAGRLSPPEAFERLMQALNALEDTLEAQKMAQGQLREAISQILLDLPDNKISLDHVGTAQITRPSPPMPSYNYRGIDLIVNQLRLEGNDELAERLYSYRKLSEPRAGSLRITRPVSKKGNDN
jgi:hypothetical protein